MATTRTLSRPAPVRAARPPARRRRRAGHRGPRRSLTPFAVIALLVAVVGLALQRSEEGAVHAPVTSHCAIPGSDLRLTTEQGANAATIAAVARSRGLPPRATVIALATAQQESRLRNLDHGDRDSLGLFQQRPSQGWGTAAQVQDPVYAAGKFFDHLVEVPGWDTGRLTEVAQAVQRSGFPPSADRSPVADRAAAVTAAVRREAGTPTVDDDGVISVAEAGWPEATWAVAHAERFGLTSVAMDGWRWTPADGWQQNVASLALPLQLRLG